MTQCNPQSANYSTRGSIQPREKWVSRRPRAGSPASSPCRFFDSSKDAGFISARSATHSPSVSHSHAPGKNRTRLKMGTFSTPRTAPGTAPCDLIRVDLTQFAYPRRRISLADGRTGPAGSPVFHRGWIGAEATEVARGTRLVMAGVALRPHPRSEDLISGRGRQYGGRRPGSIGKWRTFVVSRSASRSSAVAAMR